MSFGDADDRLERLAKDEITRCAAELEDIADSDDLEDEEKATKRSSIYERIIRAEEINRKVATRKWWNGLCWFANPPLVWIIIVCVVYIGLMVMAAVLGKSLNKRG